MAGWCAEDEQEQTSTHCFEMGAIMGEKERKATGHMKKDCSRWNGLSGQVMEWDKFVGSRQRWLEKICWCLMLHAEWGRLSKCIATDTEKVKAVAHWPVPINVSEVSSLLGLCSYYRRFIREVASIAKPLHLLTEKGRNFQCTKETQEFLEILCDRLISVPILAQYLSFSALVQFSQFSFRISNFFGFSTTEET
jgi:hypothetical protein